VGLVAETITADEQGNLYFLEHGAEQGGGRISWAPGGDLARHELFANTGGSPLGGAMTATGDLVYADAEKVRSLHSYLAARCVYFYAPNSIPKVCAWAQGLMMVEHGPDRTVTVLSTRVSNSSTLDPDTVRKPIC
jgi:hypothetical protein